jgi:maltooligosyltrehalose trehalohydrolase
MHRFEVWAPTPKKVAVSLNDNPLPMQGPDKQGWWHLDVEHAQPGADYGFLLDDDQKPYPDPRSQWQPNGVHGLSRVYEQASFSWTDASFKPAPLSDAVIYELHIGTFTAEGTLDAAIPKLEYLKSLGITHVELMPVASFAGDRGWGYDGVALFSVHQPYGGPDALKRFVDAAHVHNLAVLLDVVYNHFGPVGNYSGKYGPYIIESHKTPWGGAVNLEEEWSHEVRRFFIDNALMWMRDYHIDGLRLDAVHALVDRSAVHFLEQLSAEVEALGTELNRPLVLIAESDLNDPRVVTPRNEGGLGMDAQWSDDFHHALFSVLLNDTPDGYYSDFGKLAHLAKSIEDSFVFDGQYSSYRNRTHGRDATDIPQHRFLGYIQNHDQIGNRAIGDRLSDTVGLDKAKIAAALVLLGPFVPMIFQGEEWAASTPFQYFADHEDPEMARLVSEGRKREFAAFGWPPESIPNPEARETFEHSRLDWSEVDQGDHAVMLSWYRALIQLRAQAPTAAAAPEVHVSFDEDQNWITVEGGRYTTCCNLGDAAHQFPVPEGREVVLSSTSIEPTAVKMVNVPSNGVVVLATT